LYQIGFSLQTQYDRPLPQVLSLLHAAGFRAVSPLWSPELDFEELDRCARSLGMTVQSLHAPHKGIALLWEPDAAASREVHGNILCSIDTCARYGIPILVLHCWQGLLYTFPEAPLDFRLFDSIVTYARQKGVRVALENLEGEEYLAALMDRYRSLPHVGFCWDTGHDHCYPHKTDFMEAYGHRLIMTHLNDNLGLRDPGGVPSGKDDLHFLPGDGDLDWDHVLRRLKNAPQQAILNFEIKLRSHSQDPGDQPYLQLSLEQFIREAGKRALQLAQQYAAMGNG